MAKESDMKKVFFFYDDEGNFLFEQEANNLHAVAEDVMGIIKVCGIELPPIRLMSAVSFSIGVISESNRESIAFERIRLTLTDGVNNLLEELVNLVNDSECECDSDGCPCDANDIEDAWDTFVRGFNENFFNAMRS